MSIFQGTSYFNPIYGAHVDPAAFQFSYVSPEPTEPRVWTYTDVTV